VVKNTIVLFGSVDVVGRGREEWGDEFEVISSPTTQDDTPEKEEKEPREMTVEQAIHLHLAGFLEKRKASGDARPCGPHTLAPIYEAVFQVEKRELEDEKFLSRLKRVGLDFGESGPGTEDAKFGDSRGSMKEQQKGGKKGRKGK